MDSCRGLVGMQVDSTGHDQLLEQRLIELETRMAFQEQAMLELSEALADAREEGARNAQMMTALLSDLRKLRSELHSDPGSEPPPPHY